MCLHIRAHFDGRVLVPDERVDLPINQPLDVQVTPVVGDGAGPAKPEVIRERLDKLEAFLRQTQVREISVESLRRENLYEDRV